MFFLFSPGKSKFKISVSLALDNLALQFRRRIFASYISMHLTLKLSVIFAQGKCRFVFFLPCGWRFVISTNGDLWSVIAYGINYESYDDWFAMIIRWRRLWFRKSCRRFDPSATPSIFKPRVKRPNYCPANPASTLAASAALIPAPARVPTNTRSIHNKLPAPSPTRRRRRRRRISKTPRRF